MKIPAEGVPREELFSRMEEFRAGDLDTHGGRTWAYVYDTGRREIEEVAKVAYTMFLSENALDPTVFPSLLRFENEIVAMAASHLGGDGEVAGNFTSGGTESLILAVKTARDYFRAHRPEIREPEMILPVTGHASFHKAGHYLGVKVVPTPVDPVTFKADVGAVERAIGPNTILLVGSAASYAHGVVDPIRDLGRLAIDHGLLLHVDGCIGGFLLPYFRRLGAEVPDFDFQVPGVTSISMDLHKYAFTPKGASVILYRDRALRKHQLFACSRWTGYTVINTTVQSTKSGGPLAAAWAVLHFVGDEGYLDLARRALDATRRVVAGIERIRDLRLLGRPELCLVAFTSDTANVFRIADEMKERGWYVQPQLGFGDSRENIHLTVTPSSLERVDGMLADLAECAALAKTAKPGDLATVAREALAGVSPGDLTEEMFGQILSMGGIEGVGLPERMAEINEILNAISPEMKEALLTEFVNRLFQLREPGL